MEEGEGRRGRRRKEERRKCKDATEQTGEYSRHKINRERQTGQETGKIVYFKPRGDMVSREVKSSERKKSK